MLPKGLNLLNPLNLVAHKIINNLYTRFKIPAKFRLAQGRRNLPGAGIPAKTSDSFRTFPVVFCVTSDVTEPKTSGFLATGMYRNFRSSDRNRIASFVNFTKTLSLEGVPR